MKIKFNKFVNNDLNLRTVVKMHIIRVKIDFTNKYQCILIIVINKLKNKMKTVINSKINLRIACPLKRISCRNLINKKENLIKLRKNKVFKQIRLFQLISNRSIIFTMKLFNYQHIQIWILPQTKVKIIRSN